MTADVRQILDSFEALSDTDKHEAAVEIIRRFSGGSKGDLPEQVLVEAADDLFQALDAQEAGDGPS